MSKIIVTTGHPRSGTWWLTRLLSDLLDSPIKTLPPDNVTVSDFCRTGTGGYTIYKTHLRAHEWDGQGKAVFIQRDPRDVAVSAFFYRSRLAKTPANLLGVIKTMVCKNADPGFRIYHKTGVYEAWVRGWMELRDRWVARIKYEDLHEKPYETLDHLHHFVAGKPESIIKRAAVYDRQRFERHKHKYPHAMRKGVVGDWRNHFNREHGQLITEHLGEFMLEMDYIDCLDWWKNL